MIFFSEQEITAILLSLKVAFVAVAVSLPFGILTAVLIVRTKFFGKSILNILIHLPLVLPPVVTGYILLIIFGRKGVLGEILEQHLGLVFSFRWIGAALASGIMGFPLMVRAIRLSLETVDKRLEFAAQTLGANPFIVFITITLPLISRGIIAGMIMAFARAMGEFGATITFVSNIPGETQTLPTLIYTFTQVPTGDLAALRLTLVSVAISIIALIFSELMTKNDYRR